MKKYIPINKGHFELDTAERSASFSGKLAYGWESEYREYRRLWIDLPKTRTVRNYPLLVDLELSSICNLHCPMCYTLTDEFRQKVTKGLMDFALVQKIISEIAGKVYSVRLSLRGEPTLHPDFVKAIEFAKKSGIREVSFLTNGSTLTLENFIGISKAGADWITVSIDGTDNEYNAIRMPLKFDETLEKLRQIAEYKKNHGLVKPVIKVQGIWPAIRPNPEKYYNTLAPVSDLVAFNPLIDYLRKDHDIIYEERFACPQIYQRLAICSDGLAMMCANDEAGDQIIGNSEVSTVHELWHSAEMQSRRKIHERTDGFKEFSICLNCF
ncbi:MAG: radical SAM/SPASM domain-containing protein, partial [Candidatus Wallbacteria bacterium]|nr:radical SAM/SPASM domain-containing protein [Candidatus Wallbacteria bacterium]